ncbi:MAG: hypothetical protein FJZ43_01665 [Candidatus Staskawiczbacteria bacterium]|nr:hypothetical protein [Candidatus Staskawiczbacteria bacterium]
MKRLYLIFSIVLCLSALVFFSVMSFFSSKQNTGNQPPVQIEGISVFYPKAEEVISSPLGVVGVVNGGGWIGFEGQVGTVKLEDEDGNELASGILKAKGEWMQEVINFETTLSFVSQKEQNGKLIFYNENPSGEEERNKTFVLPIKLPKMETMQVSVFFGKYGEDECENVSEIKRIVQKTQTPARSALEELLIGPYIKENTEYFTNINSGVKIQSLIIENGVAKVDFSKELDENVAGSCRVLGIREQIEKTLKQFATVQSVVISIDGEVDEILQP